MSHWHHHSASTAHCNRTPTRINSRKRPSSGQSLGSCIHRSWVRFQCESRRLSPSNGCLRWSFGWRSQCGISIVLLSRTVIYSWISSQWYLMHTWDPKRTPSLNSFAFWWRIRGNKLNFSRSRQPTEICHHQCHRHCLNNSAIFVKYWPLQLWSRGSHHGRLHGPAPDDPSLNSKLLLSFHSPDRSSLGSRAMLADCC